MTTSITKRPLEAGGLTFGLLECGPPEGPLALCLHGFPDTAWTWRHLLPELAQAGYHAVAPALRGYAPSSVSPDGAYPLAAMINDAALLHEELGGGPDAVLIGHDWGAAIGYGATAYAPERFSKMVGLALPPPGAFIQGLLRYDQLKRSFYMFFFQTPFAEAVVAGDDMAFVSRIWADWSPGYDASEDVDFVRQALGNAENLSGALGYYRAMFDFASAPPELAEQAGAALASVPRPVLYLHGRNDGCVGAEIVEDPQIAETIRGLLAPLSRIEILDGVGHFLQLEEPERVNRLILEWLRPA